MKRLIFALYVNDDEKRFEVDDNTNNIELSELNAVIGFFASFIHNLYHMHAERHNKKFMKGKGIN